jgi:hypothetical protein
MKLVFESLEELHAFYGEAFGDSEAEKPKRTRRSKKDDATTGEANLPTGQQGGQAPAPLAPPANPNTGAVAGFTGFGAAPAPGVAAGPGFGAVGAQVVPSDAVKALVARIDKKVKEALAAGHNGEAALQWFRTECSAPQATMDQIMQVHLFQLPEQKLTQLAASMNA